MRRDSFHENNSDIDNCITGPAKSISHKKNIQKHTHISAISKALVLSGPS